ncbi:hypothetical protein SK128_016114, partial [Halocaridina rubra]
TTPAKDEKPASFKNDSSESTDAAPSLVYTQALNYIRKIKERSHEEGRPLTSLELQKLPRDSQEVVAFLKSFKSTKGFTAAINAKDGTVLHVSPTITEVLGFPRDMLIGQSFIDFVYPRDSIHLSTTILHGMNSALSSEAVRASKDPNGIQVYCRMRMYHGLKTSGFGVRNKRTIYKPCKMQMKLHDAVCGTSNGSVNVEASTSTSTSGGTTNPLNNNCEDKKKSKSLLLINITPIECAYTKPDEKPEMTSFCTRHTEGCYISAYDAEAIPYLGHLPQDVIGHSVFECYHPVDMPDMKHIYEEIVMNQGKLYKSKPYRFRAYNGSYVYLETEWLCFVNPWSKKIESIIGQHSIFQGPSDIAIFLDPGDKPSSPIPDDVLKDAKKARTDIITLLEQ